MGESTLRKMGHLHVAYYNIWIERFWNTIKREYIYLNPADDGLELYRGIKSYMEYYNNRRAHQGIGRIRPCEAYKLNAA